MSWDVHFVNGRARTVSVAIMFYDPDGCRDAGFWGTRGWWNISPGASAYVLNTNNRYFAFYAESVADGGVWSGNRGPVFVHRTGFDSCVNIGDNNPETRVVGMRQLDLHVNNWWKLV
ncbi:MAG: hypothetical protein QOJ63_935 [Solirubrobacteraceae bacterium]|jgi:uncharacterized membrane protein|nr:hypothetical protein [Solirubrobacteraceae bacterium]